jgi:hypothetical protein
MAQLDNIITDSHVYLQTQFAFMRGVNLYCYNKLQTQAIRQYCDIVDDGRITQRHMDIWIDSGCAKKFRSKHHDKYFSESDGIVKDDYN